VTLEPLSASEIRALARVFHDPGKARRLLRAAGFPVEESPAWGTLSPSAFWTAISELLEGGILDAGRARILEAAAEVFPANPVFTASRALAVPAPAAPVVDDPPPRSTVAERPDHPPSAAPVPARPALEPEPADGGPAELAREVGAAPSGRAKPEVAPGFPLVQMQVVDRDVRPPVERPRFPAAPEMPGPEKLGPEKLGPETTDRSPGEARPKANPRPGPSARHQTAAYPAFGPGPIRRAAPPRQLRLLSTIRLSGRGNTVIHMLAFAPDGGALVALDSAGRVDGWELADGRAVRSRSAKRITEGPVAAVAFSTDGDAVAVTDRGLLSWHPGGGDPAPQEVRAPGMSVGAVRAAAFVPSHSGLLVTSGPRGDFLWRLGHPVARAAPSRPDEPAGLGEAAGGLLAVDPTGKWIASAAPGGDDSPRHQVNICDVTDPARPEASTLRETEPVRALGFAGPDTLIVMTGSSRGAALTAWRPRTSLAPVRLGGTGDGVRLGPVAIRSDGLVLAGSLGQLWDFSDPTAIQRVPLEPVRTGGVLTALAFSPRHPLVAAATVTGETRIYELG